MRGLVFLLLAAPVPGQEPLWSLRPVRAPAVPDAGDAALGPIDRFVQAGLQASGIRPAQEAHRRTLIRRVTFGLTGLPPTPEEARAFVADESPGAWVRLVGRLLSSRHYGEKQARLWLDLARYADTAGDSSDYPIADAWRYRNWVIDACNADKPFDQFVREQIAGDVLAKEAPPERSADLQVATGFVALARRFGVGVRQNPHLIIEDTIDVIGRSLMGLALGCARCHDHKHDPLTLRDYYGLYGIFASTRYPFPGSENQRRPSDLVPLRALQTRTGGQGQARGKGQGATAYAVAEARPIDARVHQGGDPRRPGERVPRGFPAVITGPEPMPIVKGSGRLELARWLTDRRHPLVARVFVNRIWQQHFGTGLVRTPSDFGTHGEPPAHPELLDWLAARFVEDGWSVKALHRRILTSRTYRLASRHDPDAATKDPDNRLLWRQNRRRLTAEEIRDAMLVVSGDLDRSPGEAHPFPPMKKWNYTQHRPFVAVYPSSKRSIYVMRQRIRAHPFFGLFDGADANTATCRRSVTTVPAQALFAMNSDFVDRRAESLAARLALDTHDTAVRRAHLLALGRPPTPAETRRARAYVERFEKSAGDRHGNARALAWKSWARTLLASNEFLHVD